MPVRFQCLPAEIRVMILEYGLRFEGVINPFPKIYGNHEAKDPVWIAQDKQRTKEWASTDRPSLAPLQVSLQIHREAVVVFFGQNLWRLSCEALGLQKLDCAERDFWRGYRPLFRHITVQYQMCDVSHKALFLSDKQARIKCKGILKPKLDWWIHLYRLLELEDDWRFKRNILQRLNLKTLDMDFENFFCPSGCCRDSLWKRFAHVMRNRGPWYLTEPPASNSFMVPNVAKKCETKITVTDLEESEKDILAEHWGWRPQRR